MTREPTVPNVAMFSDILKVLQDPPVNAATDSATGTPKPYVPATEFLHQPASTDTTCTQMSDGPKARGMSYPLAQIECVYSGGTPANDYSYKISEDGQSVVLLDSIIDSDVQVIVRSLKEAAEDAGLDDYPPSWSNRKERRRRAALARKREKYRSKT